jgi:hypothetical protein
MSTALLTLRRWSGRRWRTAAVAGVAIAVLVALPTAVIPNPVFGREIGVTWWSYPVVVITGILGGLLVATYVRDPELPGAAEEVEADRPMRLATVGGLVSFFAVGCPVCNKLVLLALGASGAVTWFAPIQPLLALASIALMSWALAMRLRTGPSCPVPEREPADRAQ